MANTTDQVRDSSSLLQKIMQTLALLALVLGFFLFSNAIGYQIAELTGVKIDAGKTILNMGFSTEVIKKYVYISQLSGTVIGMLILPALYILFGNKNLSEQFLNPSSFSLRPYLIATLVVFTITPFIGKLGVWNKNIQLPEVFSSLESTMKSLEETAAQVTELLVRYESAKDFILVFILIALLPAVAEELVFRGILQSECIRIWKSPVLAILISAFVFSFIHFQFYGFFVRFLLGIVLGILYYYSGSLMVSIWMHLVNNTTAFVLMNWYYSGQMNMDPEGDMDLPWAAAIASIAVTSYLLFLVITNPARKKIPHV